MITAQDIREKTFEKSRIGGYDMEGVDEFLEAIAEELTAAQKESAVLKSKMKVLVDKIEEYRSNESSLNQALLSAQKLAAQIEAEARAKADAMIADADAQVKEKLGTIQEKTEFEEKRLAAAKAASEKFFDGMRAMCSTQMKNIDNISEGMFGRTEAPKIAAPAAKIPEAERPVAEPAASEAPAQEFSKDVDEAVKSIEASVSKIKPARSMQFDFGDEMDAAFAPSKRDRESTQPFTL